METALFYIVSFCVCFVYSCLFIFCSAEGTEERTEVYVVPEADFVQWYLAEKSFPDEGVKLHVQTTFWPEKVIPKQG